MVVYKPQVSVKSLNQTPCPLYSYYLKMATVLPSRDIMGVSTRQSPVEKSCLGVTLTTMQSSPLLRFPLAVQFSTQWLGVTYCLSLNLRTAH